MLSCAADRVDIESAFRARTQRASCISQVSLRAPLQLHLSSALRRKRRSPSELRLPTAPQGEKARVSLRNACMQKLELGRFSDLCSSGAWQLHREDAGVGQQSHAGLQLFKLNPLARRVLVDGHQHVAVQQAEDDAALGLSAAKLSCSLKALEHENGHFRTRKTSA
ncbi:hypothetical protein Efla_007685 [Eimeria flavescens]